jgi:hypothetical protein
MPPARASGEILKKGTAVVTTLILSAVCAVVFEKKEPEKNRTATAFNVDCLIKSMIWLTNCKNKGIFQSAKFIEPHEKLGKNQTIKRI